MGPLRERTGKLQVGSGFFQIGLRGLRGEGDSVLLLEMGVLALALRRARQRGGLDCFAMVQKRLPEVAIHIVDVLSNCPKSPRCAVFAGTLFELRGSSGADGDIPLQLGWEVRERSCAPMQFVLKRICFTDCPMTFIFSFVGE